MEERISMSTKELNRLEVLTRVTKGQLKRPQAAKELGISLRQVGYLLKRLVEEGPKGLISRKLGRPSNHQLSDAVKERIIGFFKDEDHYDFGPTLAHEYLSKEGHLGASISSVRTVMMQNGLWHPNKVQKLKIHPLRTRRSQKGALVQLDGSEHAWFEERGPRSTLLVYVDDATSEIMHLKFVPSENTLDYLDATREYIEKHGRPEAFYPDKHSVFRVNHPGALSGDGRTQFSRAMEELKITLICAHSPQAKGRVERRNRDLQNRLLKAMRIAKISTIEAANAFIPSFLKEFNEKFAKAPKDPTNAHRALLSTQNLDRIFCIKHQRRLSKNLTLQYNNVIYQIIAHRTEYSLRRAEVTIVETKGGRILIEHRGKILRAVPYHKMQAQTEVVSSKELWATLEKNAINLERIILGNDLCEELL